MAGAGCNVPAIIGTRVLTTMRERTIASTLIVLIPCSARTAVILGALASLAGWQYGVAVFLLMGLLVAAVGFGLNKVMPGKSSGLVMEMFPVPHAVAEVHLHQDLASLQGLHLRGHPHRARRQHRPRAPCTKPA